MKDGICLYFMAERCAVATVETGRGGSIGVIILGDVIGQLPFTLN